MDTEEIAHLCASLSISEIDGPICKVDGEVKRLGCSDVTHCLVGKVLSCKKVNREAFRGVIEQLWSVIGSVEIESLGDNLFVFFFKRLEDRASVWARGPWHFDHNLIVLEKPEGVGAISKMNFDKLEIWVQVYNIPLMCMNRGMARLIAEQIGEVVEIPGESKDCRGRFLRVKVQIDISRSLKRVVRMDVDGDLIVALLKYERLPEFCFACGKIGHGMRDCTDDEARTEALEGAATKFGSWMRAPLMDRFKGRFLKQEGRGSVLPSSVGPDQGKKGSSVISEAKAARDGILVTGVEKELSRKSEIDGDFGNFDRVGGTKKVGFTQQLVSGEERGRSLIDESSNVLLDPKIQVINSVGPILGADGPVIPELGKGVLVIDSGLGSEDGVTMEGIELDCEDFADRPNRVSEELSEDLKLQKVRKWKRAARA
ncbi:hypothetical protein ACOSQ2_018349 [Xanthoceras sorbifolium]